MGGGGGDVGIYGLPSLFQAHPVVYLMGPYNAGPKLALFLQVAEIRAGVKRARVKRAGVKRAVFWLKNSKKRR